MQSLVIIDSSLLGPPSEDMSVYSVTFFAKINLNLQAVVFTDREWRDLFWNYIKSNLFLKDYIKEIIFPEDCVNGITLEPEPTYSLDILVDRINSANLNFILERLDMLRRF